MSTNESDLNLISMQAGYYYGNHKKLESEHVNGSDELDEFQRWMVRSDANTLLYTKQSTGALVDSFSDYDQMDQYDKYLEVLKEIAGRAAVDTVDLMIRRSRALLDAKVHFTENNEAYVKIALFEAAIAGIDINYPNPI